MLFLFNTNIVPGPAVVRVTEITAEQAKELVTANKGVFTSAIGHDATASAISKLLNVECPVNRIPAQPEAMDIAISLKLNGRIPEGVILDEAQMNEIGYKLYVIEFYSSDCQIRPKYQSNFL